ncbi:hypothetical protein AAVH_27607 [Aphelenchoides avenae]|nr:hypothetical protein AAVH_27607 [Aphelenchus avenae]
MDGFCNRYEQCANPQCTDFDDDSNASAYEGGEMVSFYDNGTRLFDVYADLVAQATLDASDVKVWTTNAFDGFFGISTAFGGDSRSPVNRSIASVLLSRTCEEGYTANAGYITYGMIHPLCNIVGYTPIYNGTEWDFPSVRITTIRNGKNRIDGQSGVTTLDSLKQDIVLPKVGTQ